MPQPLLCNPKAFKDQFRRDTKDRKERRYCFILGAGASVSSGIPSGKTLAARWLGELYERQCPTPETNGSPMTIEEWCRCSDCSVRGVDPRNPGNYYPQLFQARFPGADPEGQRFIQEAIRGDAPDRPNVPSVGYAYLALILQQTDSRVVITTNFDNLAADALLLFTGSLPRVVGHERVASFAGLRDGQPLIAKIHGDVGFVTANDPAGVSKLHEEWAAPLRDIFRDHIPVFIGYEGDDGSLMDFLCEKAFGFEEGAQGRSLLRSGLYWCYRAEGGRDWQTRIAENARLKRLAECHQVHFVPIGDFDLWLMELGIACDVGDPEQILRENMERRVSILAAQIGRARGDQAIPAATQAVEVSRATTREEIGKKLTEWEWVYKARAEKDPDKADNHYRQAIAIAPGDPDILGDYAVFQTETRKDHDRAQELFERALTIAADNANNLGNFAVFLGNTRNDYDRAQNLFERALAISPNAPTILGNYANFLKRIRKDHNRAQNLYERALSVTPNDATILGNYANLMYAIRSDHAKAQELYKRALSINPDCADILSNYATFLRRIRKDHDQAQELFERALMADPNHTGNLGNYADFLAEIRKDYNRAQELYERALLIDPNHAYNLAKYAGFMANIRKDYDRAREFYKRAFTGDPDNPSIIGNYAEFLMNIRKDHDQAQELCGTTLTVDPR